jgi:hypothetical protein
LAHSAGRCKVAASSESPPCVSTVASTGCHSLPRMDGAEEDKRQLMYVSMAVVLQTVARGVGAGGFCEGLSRRPFPLVVRVRNPGLPASLLPRSLLPVFPPTELPFPRPLLLFDMHRLCLDVDMLSPAVVLHGPPRLP